MPHYQPTDALQSPRFCGIRTFARLPFVTTTEDVDATIIGIPFDTGVSYRAGARFGPAAIRDASALLRPYNPGQSIDVFGTLSVTDSGDISVVPGYIEDSYAHIEAGLQPILDAGIVPISLGGDHSITLAELRAVAKKYGPLGLAHFDAHSDTWDEYFGHKYNHGTTFRRALEEGLLEPQRCIQVGMRGPLYDAGDYDVARQLGLAILPNDEMRQHSMAEVSRMVRERVGSGPTFLTFDVDFVDPAYTPGTGTPEVGGVTSWEALQLLRGLRGINFVACDIVEVLPSYDPTQITALLAANVAYEMLSLIAVQKKR
ncbi:agmatinase [Dictyobacter kobayashii]|uniref:Agmatinase n=1 Tax=Dictyobacter kobayashii TaxID=2014872 RepID=A0A402ATK0_9CHLR|nr:agmatinase [Dictyobacter kobayashii]GCE22422.1 agmatinase [Dictyobacter kobayashii]